MLHQIERNEILLAYYRGGANPMILGAEIHIQQDADPPQRSTRLN